MSASPVMPTGALAHMAHMAHMAQQSGVPAWRLLLCALLVLLGLATVPLVHAQEGNAAAPTPKLAQPLTVGVAVAPPFVMDEGGEQWRGLAIDLWEEVAARRQWPFSYRRYADFGQLLEAVSAGEVDMAISSLTINQQRAHRMDFTQPWFDGGMRIMVDAASDGGGLRGFWRGMQRAGFARIYGWIALALLVATVLFTLFDRRFDQKFPRRWRDGLAESFYTAMKFATSGQTPLRENHFGWLGRIWQALVLLVGIAVVAFVTSSVTSIMTTQALRSQINGLQDLAGVPVGVLTGTVEEDFARAQGLALRSYPDLAQASSALRAGEVRAVIADGPMLEYHVHKHPGTGLATVGRTFNRDRYGFALPKGSALTAPLTLEVLGATDRGRIEALKLRYFGAQPEFRSPR